MGFQYGHRALISVIIIILSININPCQNSKITFPGEEEINSTQQNSPTKSTIVTATPTPSSSSSSSSLPPSSISLDSVNSIKNSFNLDLNLDLNQEREVSELLSSKTLSSSEFSGDNNEISENFNSKNGGSSFISFIDDDNQNNDKFDDNDNQLAEVKSYMRSLEIDSREINNPDRRLRDRDYDRDRERDRWNGWKFEDNYKRWPAPPDEKTIALQVLDEDPYHHGRPAWPHDEYLMGYFDLKANPERSNGSYGGGDNLSENLESTISPEEISKFYEWKRLQPSRPSPSAFIGPGFYDVSSLGPSSTSSSSSSSGDYYRYHQPHFSAITTEGTGKVQTTGSGSGAGGGGGGSSAEGSVPGTPSESNTNTRHFPAYHPYDFYKRKRLRLQIHPGLIAAPLAGLAAFGAASALTSKPLLVELGYVRNKPELIGGGIGGGGGWGFAGTPGTGYRPYPPFYPPPNAPPIYPPIGVGTGSVGHGHHHHHRPIGGGLGLGIGGGIAHSGAYGQAGGGGLGGGPVGGGGPIYPILKPIRHKPESERSSWWNPFSGLTPRLVIE